MNLDSWSDLIRQGRCHNYVCGHLWMATECGLGAMDLISEFTLMTRDIIFW